LLLLGLALLLFKPSIMAITLACILDIWCINHSSVVQAGAVSASGATSPRSNNISAHALDGTALFGAAKPFILPEVHDHPALSQVEVEAEADRIVTCNLLAKLAARAKEKALQDPAQDIAVQEVTQGSEGAGEAQANNAPHLAVEGAEGTVQGAETEVQAVHSCDVTEILEPSNMDGTVQAEAAVTQQLDEPKADIALTLPVAEATPAAVAEASSLAQPQGVSQMTHKGKRVTREASNESKLLTTQPSQASAEGTLLAYSQSGCTENLTTPQSPARPAVRKPGKKKAATKGVEKDAVSEKYKNILAGYASPPEVYSGIYLCDFGQIIKGLSASKKIVVQNTSTQLAVLSVDKALLEACSCSLSPEKLPKLDGAPRFASAELTLTMHTNLAHVCAEAKEFYLPLNVRNAPPVIIVVRALVVVPEVVCSSSELDFGSVQWGMSKVHTVHLKNQQSVPAEWSVKQATEDVSGCSPDYYRCEPASGVIAPHSRMSVKVYFTPDHPSKHAEEYPHEISIRVAHNNRRTVITVNGTCYLARARIVPKTLDLGVVLPTNISSAAPISGDFEIQNNGLTAIEIFSLDFDTQYLEEEATLSEWQGYRVDLGYALLRPRAPGEPFWQEIVQDVQAAREAARQADETAACVQSAHRVHSTDNEPAADAAVPSLPKGDRKESSPIANTEETSVAQPTASPEAVAAPSLQKDEVGELEGGVQPPFYAIVAALQADVAAEQSARLAERYGVPHTTLTDLVLDAGELAEEFEGTPFEGGLTFGDFLYEELIGWECVSSEVSAGKKQPKPYLTKPAPEVEELVTRAMAAALRQSKFARGFIIEGLACEFASAGPVLRALLQILALEEAPAADGDEASPKVWQWDRELWFVTLDTTLEEADARYKAQSTPEQIRAEAEAALAASVTAPTDTVKGKKPPPKKGGKNAAPELPPAPAIPAGVSPSLGAQWVAFQSVLQAAEALMLAEHPQNAVKRRKVQLGLSQANPEDLHQQVIGLHFMQGTVRCVLPPAHADRLRIPPPYLLQVVCRPHPRKPRKTPEGLSLMAVLPPLPPAPKTAAPPEATKGKPSKGATASVESTPEEPPSERLVPQARWVLHPGESAPARLQFSSSKVTELNFPLTFGVYSGEARIPLTVKVSCAYPQISSDPRNVFRRRTKGKAGREGALAVRRQYVTSRKRFEFGPLLIGQQAPEGAEGATHGHATTLCLTNNGRFDLKARLRLKSALEAEARAAAPELESKGKGSQKVKGKAAVAEDVPPGSPFSIQSESLDLKVDETAEVTVWCFPTELGDVADAVVCIIENHPEPVEFSMTAIGTAPAVQVRLQENDAEEAADVDPAKDSSEQPEPQPGSKGTKPAEPVEPSQTPNKLLDEGVVFERLLPGRTATKGVVITNKSDLPVWWELAGLEDLPQEFTLQLPDEKGKMKPITSVSGVLAVGMSTTLQIVFRSIPLEGDDAANRVRSVEHTVTLLVQDSAKTLGVVQSEVIVLQGETYLVDAELVFDSEDVQGIDFGLLKVCDLLCHDWPVCSSGCECVSWMIHFARCLSHLRFQIGFFPFRTGPVAAALNMLEMVWYKVHWPFVPGNQSLQTADAVTAHPAMPASGCGSWWK
jgi:hydrocephalus-inducing protein